MRRELPGQGASRGSALGRARVRLPHVLEVAEERIDDVDAELERLHDAIRIVRAEMHGLRARLHGALAQEVGEFLDPSILNAHNVIHEPDVIGYVVIFQTAHLCGDVLRTTRMVGLAPDGFGAPIAMERAAARRHQIQAGIAVMRLPDVAIAGQIDQFPSWTRERIELAQHRAGTCALNGL